MMVLSGVVVDLVQFVIQGMGAVSIAALTDLLDDFAKRILPGLETGRQGRRSSNEFRERRASCG